MPAKDFNMMCFLQLQIIHKLTVYVNIHLSNSPNSTHLTMPLTDKDRRIAYSIVRHLQAQVERGHMDDEAAEGIVGEIHMV